MGAEMQDKQILISLKAVNKDVAIHILDTNMITNLFKIISNHFKKSKSCPIEPPL